ncbi:MAG TPA: NAD(P)/FAD-dependent oxidoreductase [Clostridiales bacterium]|jgi:flavin-dependent dehydrogenase|nr:NAD(P)/FAD-dependent oxidoreductase [Clostridiales bacterium]
MKKKIIVAGAGHGGLNAAAFLAKAGFRVDVYEQKTEDEMGYDWSDTISRHTFEYMDFDDYDRAYLSPRLNTSFYAPNLKTPVNVDFDKESTALDIERAALYKYLIRNAKDKGAEIHWGKRIDGPLIKDKKVRGLMVEGQEEGADLVIDSAGLRSVVLAGLPKEYEMDEEFSQNDVFHTFRGYFNLLEGVEAPNMHRFNTYFRFDGLKGIAWFKISDNMADMLVGSVEDLDTDRVEEVLDKIRKVQPAAGRDLLRGGQIIDIPIKSTHTLLVGDNYAAVGDCVSMTIPMVGSGITNAIEAGKMLAETIIEAGKAGLPFTKENLWPYQYSYYKFIGAAMLENYVLKNYLLNISEKTMNFFFDNEILTDKELGDSTSLANDKKAALEKVKKGYKRIFSLLKLKKTVEKSALAKEVALQIPEKYEEEKVKAWREKLAEFMR